MDNAYVFDEDILAEFPTIDAEATNDAVYALRLLRLSYHVRGKHSEWGMAVTSELVAMLAGISGEKAEDILSAVGDEVQFMREHQPASKTLN